MKLERILVAVNTPSGRDAAFERALALARWSGAELYLLHAVPANTRFSFRAAERLERMADMRRRAESLGVRVQTVEQHGNPAEMIELHANARAADLIVMGSEAQRAWRQPRSAVAESVIRRTHVPTLVVAGDALDGPPAPFQNVLAAVDLSPESKDVIRGALAFAEPNTLQLTVMHVVKGAAQSRAHDLKDARRSVEATVSEVPALVGAHVQVWAGASAPTIVEYAAEIDADLVVVGRSGGFKLPGSTALRVLRENNRALLVIPGAAHRANRVERQRAA